MNNKTDFIYITKSSQLKTCVKDLSRVKEAAFDLEFDKNRYRYGFNLCLIQLAVNGKHYLVDPLADSLDIDSLLQELAREDLLLVGFALGEDLSLLNALDCVPRNVFDLGIAVRFLDFTQCSLQTALKELLDIEISKADQRSNWFKRPLTEEQKIYAVNDVQYLARLKQIILEQAEERGVMDWIGEEMELLNTRAYEEEEGEDIVKDKEKFGLSDKEWLIYKGLMELRDATARTFNKPAHYICGRELIREIARRPSLADSWSRSSGIYHRIKNRRFEDKIHCVIARAEAEARNAGVTPCCETVKRPSRSIEERRQFRKRIDQLKKMVFHPIREAIAEKYGMRTAEYIINNRLITAYAEEKPEKVLDYRRCLIDECADRLSLDLNLPPG